jgi:hypothetical protein
MEEKRITVKNQTNGNRNNHGHNGKKVFTADKRASFKMSPEVADVFEKLKKGDEVFSFSKNKEIKKIENVKISAGKLQSVNPHHFYILKDEPNGLYLMDVKLPKHFRRRKNVNHKIITFNFFASPELIGEGKEIIADVIVKKKIFLEPGNVEKSTGAVLYLDIFPKNKNGEEVKPRHELIIGANEGDPALRIPGTKKFIGVKKISVG